LRFTSLPGSATGSGRRSIWLKSEKMAVFAPIPRASDTTATMVTKGGPPEPRRTASFVVLFRDALSIFQRRPHGKKEDEWPETERGFHEAGDPQ
jgi:hypothetical protein